MNSVSMPKPPATRARSAKVDNSVPVASVIATSGLHPHLCQRQREPEGRALLGGARHELDVTVHPQRQLAPDRKPEAEATLAGAPAAALEPFEDPVALHVGHPRTGTRHLRP